MAGIRTPQNPGIGGLDELTDAEETFLTTFAGLSANENDVLSFVSSAPLWQSFITVPIVNSAVWRFSSTVGVKMSTETAIGRDFLTIEATSGSNTDMDIKLLPKGDGVTNFFHFGEIGNLGKSSTPWTNTFTNELILFNVRASSASSNKLNVSAVDLSAGNTILSINTEGTGVVGSGTPTANRTVAIEVNGTVYYLIASTTAS